MAINESECVYFTATANQPIDTWRWFLDGDDQGNNVDEFTHCWAVGGEYYVAVNATNANGTSDTITWTVTVEDVTAPASITNLGSETGNFWINWTWTNPEDADFSRVMIYIDDLFVTNVSEPQNWYNGTYEPHATKTISTHTVDTSGNINEAWVYQTTTIPNNVPVMEAIAPEFPAIGETVTIDANANDPDYTDTLIYSCNRTDLFTDFNPATGIGSWTPLAAGTYYVDFGVSDGYIGGTDNETVMIVVSGTGVDLKVEGAEYAEKTVAPGETATYLLTVKNVGSVPDTYTLSVVDNPNGADVAELNRTTIPGLGQGETAIVLLNVSDAIVGEYVVNVTVTGTYPSVSDEVMTKTIVAVTTPFTRDLLEGWNMFGVPLNVSDWTLPAVLSSIEGKYDYVYYYNATTGGMDYYVAAHPEVSTLTELEPLAGYLVDISVADTLQFEAKKFVAPSRDLESGWNMFSVPYGVVDKTLPTVLSSVEGKYDYVYYYNATTGGMDYYVAAHPEVSTLTELEPGAGYLINMTEAGAFIPNM
ncbi:hypothetical protein KAW18_09990 [candidate division WOR-3 bacterium]|nr:hypothetical protein [candidate division WOR-3 bacterium]